MRRVVGLLALCCATSGPPEHRVWAGTWRAIWHDWSGADVCETEPSWLLEELTQVNEVLERFTAKQGTWREDELPVLEEAVRGLDPVVDAHLKNIAAAARCPFAQTGVYRATLEKGASLANAARAELDSAPKLLAFVHHQQALERWRKSLVQRREAGRSSCADAGTGPTVYFAWSDELEGTTYLYCDGAVVRAALTGAIELVATPESWPVAQLKSLREKCLDLARLYPGGLIERPPR
jgi:hypothetical protein